MKGRANLVLTEGFLPSWGSAVPGKPETFALRYPGTDLGRVGDMPKSER